MRTTYCDNCETTVRFYTDFGPGLTWLRICTECDGDLNYNYKVCIIAAGTGTRSRSVSGLHKALLPIENRPVISHILDQFDKRIEIVVAVGYEANQIKSYLNEVHSDRKITYVDVDNYDGSGSGPGYSLLCCKDELQHPFVYTAADTIVEVLKDSEIMDYEEDSDNVFTFLGENWIGASDVKVEESLNYCLIKGKNDYLVDLYYGKGNRAYTGIAGVVDYEDFWKGLEDGGDGNIKHTDDLHEYNADSGFRGLSKIKIVDFKWYDTGNTRSYNEVRKVFNKEVVANKSDEALFIDKNKVVKYFSDPNKIKVRVERLNYMNDNCPKVKQIHSNLYSYDYVEGKLLSEINDVSIFETFLNWYNSPDGLVSKESTNKKFYENCSTMYERKTLDRLSKMKDTNLDKIEVVNGVKVKPIIELLNQINWSDIYNAAIPSRFHGDLQLENIIYREDTSFALIDWRQTFGESKEVGDIYYDLGKIWHSLPINGKTILNKMYRVNYDETSAEVEYFFRSNLLKFYFKLKEFCDHNSYDWNVVTLVGILHYLNICTLYDNFQGGKYGEFLFLLGKLMLTKNLEGEEVI